MWTIRRRPGPKSGTAARRIVSSGAATCGFTSAWLTWIHLENFAAWNNLPYATNQNGMAGPDIELKVNAPLYVKHFQELADLAAEGVFHYGGRTSEAKQLFLSGECGMYTDSSGGLGDVVKSGIDYGTGPLPYEPEAEGAPQNTIPGGASLWVFAGHSDAEYKGVAKFFEFLSQTEIQSRLHQMSGYLPVTMAAYEATKASGFYENNPGREQPILQMTDKDPDGQFARHPRRQPAGASRNPERGVRGDARGPGERPAGPRQRGSPRQCGGEGGAREVAHAASRKRYGNHARRRSHRSDAAPLSCPNAVVMASPPSVYSRAVREVRIAVLR